MLNERPSEFILSKLFNSVAGDSESPNPAPAPGTPIESNKVFDVLVPGIY